MEALIYQTTIYLRLFAETISILIVMIGIIVTLSNLTIRAFMNHDWSYYNQARIVLSRFLVLALEFLLASDILGTAIRSSWSDLGQIAVIAVIRTFLNYFLLRESEVQEKITTPPVVSH